MEVIFYPPIPKRIPYGVIQFWWQIPNGYIPNGYAPRRGVISRAITDYFKANKIFYEITECSPKHLVVKILDIEMFTMLKLTLDGDSLDQHIAPFIIETSET